LAKATFYTENGKSEKRHGFWCQVERIVMPWLYELLLLAYPALLRCD